MPKDIFETKVDGTIFKRRRMDNGEFRDSIMAPDGSGYIRTSMPEDGKGEWQNAHLHGGSWASKRFEKGAREMIVVVKGWIGTAELMADGSRVVKVFSKNQYFETHPGEPHNIYMPPGAVTHCDKYGEDVGNPDEQRKGADWWPAPEDFDAWSKSLTVADIWRHAGLDDPDRMD